MKGNSIKKALYLLLILAVSLPVLAGTEWKTGYVVKNSNDTLHGLIAYNGGGNEWEYCSFKTSEKSPVQRFTPEETKSYYFESGLCYKTMNVSAGRFSGKCFVRSLVQGKCDLNYFEMEVTLDTVYRIYFAENKVDGVVARMPLQNVSGTVQKQRMYTSLNMFFGHHPLMQNDLKHSKFTMDELIALFDKYNSVICGDQTCITYIEEKSKSRRFWVSLQLQMQFTGVPRYQREGFQNLKGQFGFDGAKVNSGIEAIGSMSLSKHSDRFLMNVGLGISPLSLYLYEEVKTDYKFKALALTNSVSFTIRWLNYRVRPFIEIGAFQMGTIVTKNTLSDALVQDFKNEFPDALTLPEPDKIRKYNMGLLLSAGMDIKLNSNHHIPVRVSAYQATLYDSNQYFQLRTSRYQIAVGYTFQVK